VTFLQQYTQNRIHKTVGQGFGPAVGLLADAF